MIKGLIHRSMIEDLEIKMISTVANYANESSMSGIGTNQASWKIIQHLACGFLEGAMLDGVTVSLLIQCGTFIEADM